MLRCVIILCCALVLHGAALAQEYSVVVQKSVAGYLKVTRQADGEVRTDFSYRNNGRGPDIREAYALDRAGAPRQYAGEGTSTMGAEIRESFESDGTRTRWNSRVDHGDVATTPGAVFIPLEPTFAYMSELARALLKRDDPQAAVVGGGTLVLERAATLTVQGTTGPAPLILLTLHGVDVAPWHYWFHDNERKDFFGVAYPGFAVVQEGFESTVDDLLRAEQQAADARQVALQKQAATPLPGLTLIQNVRWFDAPAAKMRGPADIYLRAGLVTAVTAPGLLQAQPDQVIDGGGRTLLPGLFDMHYHVWAGTAPLNLAAGVTSAREMGGENSEVLRLKARFDAGELPGPTVYPAGFIEGKSPHSARYGFVVDSVDEGKRAIDWYAARGYRQIKLYNSIRPAWAKPLAAHAKARGMRVSGHVPAFMKAREAVLAGYDELTHINQVMLNFVGQPGDDVRTLIRFTRVGDDASRVDIKGPEVRAFIRLLKERGTVVDPTAAVFEGMFTQQQGQPDPGLQAIADHLPVLWRRQLKSASMDLEGQKLTRYRAAFGRMLELVKALHQSGITLVAGTDSWAAITLHRELELYVQAGIPAPEVLRIATWNGARVAKADAVAGSIAAGKRADLVLIDGDPSTRISDIRRTALVLKGGVAYSPAALYEAMGFSPLVPAAHIQPAAAAQQSDR